MRFEKVAFVSSLALVLGAPACGSILQQPPDGGRDGGQDTSVVACRQLGEAACRTRSDCAVGSCSICGGGAPFISCYDPATETGPICAAIACPAPCSILDEASCKTRTDCRVDACPNCNGGSGFVRCSASGDPPIGCPAILCPLPCAQTTTKEACEARPDCHSVFVDSRDCACAALGCCARFSRCADGDKANCNGPSVLCDVVTPYCEGPYVVSYTAACYEGCVKSSDCGP
jgi:hypothetical protein